MTKKISLIVLGFVIIAALVLGVVSFFRPVSVQVGAMPGNELQGPEFIVGGITHYFRNVNFSQASTTLCRLQAPSATSTLVFHSIDFRSATGTGAVILDIAKTTNALSYASTTQIGTTYLLVASTGVTIVGSSTPAATGDRTIFNPNNWLIFKVASTQGVGGFVPKGTCKAEWIKN